jgi:hypothetical protein
LFAALTVSDFFQIAYKGRAALGRFHDQGAGVLINVSSVWGRVSSPLVSSYVVTIVPESVDTPIFTHAAN